MSSSLVRAMKTRGIIAFADPSHPVAWAIRTEASSSKPSDPGAQFLLETLVRQKTCGIVALALGHLVSQADCFQRVAGGALEDS